MDLGLIVPLEAKNCQYFLKNHFLFFIDSVNLKAHNLNYHINTFGYTNKTGVFFRVDIKSNNRVNFINCLYKGTTVF